MNVILLRASSWLQFVPQLQQKKGDEYFTQLPDVQITKNNER